MGKAEPAPEALHTSKDAVPPFLRTWWDKDRIMVSVIAALFPAAAAGVYFFGIPALMVLATTVLTALIADLCCQLLIRRHDPDHRLKKVNWSSVLTGLLLGLVLPPRTPLILAALGSVVAVALGKYAFGKGNNIFNPALMARLFLVLSFPVLMGRWVLVDGLTSATPLSQLKSTGYGSLLEAFGGRLLLYKSAFLGHFGGSIGETSALALLFGGLVLIMLNIIDWRIPAGFIGAAALVSALFSRDTVFEILSGGIMIGAFFMATDYVTSPLTRKGRWVFAVGCGLLTMLFRLYSGYPEGVAFAILLMNSAVPLIDRFTLPVPPSVREKRRLERARQKKKRKN